MRIGIVGSGISGLTAAHHLSRQHDITLFEAGDYVGGHTHTVDVEHVGKSYAVDTGFIVFNDWTYPKFIELMTTLGVAWQRSQMSFSVRCENTGLEYNGTSVNSLFAQRRNFFRPSFLRMVSDILRFNKHAPALLLPDGDGGSGNHGGLSGVSGVSLGDYLEREGYSSYFIEHYIIPMGAAIWSSRPIDMLRFPARFFVEFFANHGFLSVNERPTWQVIRGGSREYVKKLTAPFANRIRLRTPVESILRQRHQVTVRTRGGDVEHFDYVFMACHSDQALRLLADPSSAEQEVLGAIRYQANEAVLHTDERMMPRRALARAAWNYHLPIEQYERVTVTYNMNILQSIDAPAQFMLTLNRSADVDPAKVIGSYVYDHPVYTAAAVAAQKRRRDISGVRRTLYCGAYWSYGFHEDGVTSALAALEDFKQASRGTEHPSLRPDALPDRVGHAQPHLQRVG